MAVLRVITEAVVMSMLAMVAGDVVVEVVPILVVIYGVAFVSFAVVLATMAAGVVAACYRICTRRLKW